jgi:hypothetical protein
VTRTVTIDARLARALGRLRADAKRHNLAHAPRDLGPVSVSLHAIESVEREVGATLPDPVIAFLAAGVSPWGDGPVRLSLVAPRTLELREDGIIGEDFVVIDNDSNGNVIAFNRTSRNPDELWFVDHETDLDSASAMSLIETIDGVRGEPEAAPFELTIDPTPPLAPAERWVSHAKFGRGVVVSEADDVVTVRFEGVGEKRVKRSFLR